MVMTKGLEEGIFDLPYVAMVLLEHRFVPKAPDDRMISVDDHDRGAQAEKVLKSSEFD
jgi:hypothetical protein